VRERHDLRRDGGERGEQRGLRPVHEGAEEGVGGVRGEHAGESDEPLERDQVVVRDGDDRG
jgi:hypothetical protein